MNLYIIRHGHSLSNLVQVISCKLPGLGLSEKGQAQALEASAYFKDKAINKVFVSPFLRTIETAEIICSEIGIKDITADTRVREHDFGTWEGLNGDDMATDLIAHLKLAEEGQIDIKFTDSGETQIEFLSRVYGWLYSLKDLNVENVLLVTHASPADVISKLIAEITNTKQIGSDLKNCEVISYELNDQIFEGVKSKLDKLNI